MGPPVIQPPPPVKPDTEKVKSANVWSALNADRTALRDLFLWDIAKSTGLGAGVLLSYPCRIRNFDGFFAADHESKLQTMHT